MEQHVITTRPVFATVDDPTWAAVLRAGTPLHLTGGVPLAWDAAAGRYRVQHPYYPPVLCDVPADAVTPRDGAPAYRGALPDPRCFNAGLRLPRGHRACRCLGCWALWWQARAAAAGITYARRTGPGWARQGESHV